MDVEGYIEESSKFSHTHTIDARHIQVVIPKKVNDIKSTNHKPQVETYTNMGHVITSQNNNEFGKPKMLSNHGSIETEHNNTMGDILLANPKPPDKNMGNFNLEKNGAILHQKNDESLDEQSVEMVMETPLDK